MDEAKVFASHFIDRYSEHYYSKYDLALVVLMLRYFITKEQNSLGMLCFPVFMRHTPSLNIELFVTWVFLCTLNFLCSVMQINIPVSPTQPVET